MWKITVNEELETKMEPDNVMNKYAVCVKNNTFIVEHLSLGKNGKFAKMIFYFTQSRPRYRMQSCHTWQKSQSWRRGWNASSLQVEDLRPKKNGGSSL